MCVPAWHRVGVGWFGGPSIFHQFHLSSWLSIGACYGEDLEAPQSSFHLPQPLVRNTRSDVLTAQLGRWTLRTERGAAREVTPREFGTNTGKMAQDKDLESS